MMLRPPLEPYKDPVCPQATSEPQQPQIHAGCIHPSGEFSSPLMWVPLYPLIVVPPHPLRTAEPDLLQRREKKATSPHAVNVLVLHLPTQCSQGQEMGQPRQIVQTEMPATHVELIYGENRLDDSSVLGL